MPRKEKKDALKKEKKDTCTEKKIFAHSCTHGTHIHTQTQVGYYYY